MSQLNAIASQATELPPSFDGSHPAYGFALFGLLLISAVSAAVIVRCWRAWRQDDTRGLNAPATAWRLILATLFATMLFGALPDVLVMLAWGEVGAPTMEWLLVLDKFMDGFALAPFTTGVLILVRTEDQLVYQLIRRPPPIALWSTWPAVRQQLQFVALVAVVAIGVTLGK